MPLPMRNALDAQQTWATFKDWLMRLYDHTADFGLRYYGPLSANPTLNPLGEAMQAGDTYYSIPLKYLKVYNGTNWERWAEEVAAIAAIAADVAEVELRKVLALAIDIPAAIASIAATVNRGAWIADARTYAIKDIVSVSGTWYICVAAHSTTLASVFATDALTKWRVYQGMNSGDLGYEVLDVQATLDDAKSMANYTALRAYTGRATGIRITTPGIDGLFQRRGTTSLVDNGGTIIVDASGRAWERLFVGSVSVKWFGAKGDGATDDYAAIMAANNSATYGGIAGPSLFFPPGRYFCSQTFDLNRRSFWFGNSQSTGNPQDGDTALIFPANITGIVVNSYNTGGGTTLATPTTGADSSVFEDFSVVSLGASTDGSKPGIWLRARAAIRGVSVRNFGGEGILVQASVGAGGAGEGNANNFRIAGGRISGNKKDGIKIIGADANAGTVDGVDSSQNSGWGINDSSFLGNELSGLHTAGNLLGAYCTTNINCRSVFTGCYSESDQPPSSIISPALSIGGQHAAGFAGNAPHISSEQGEMYVSRAITSRKPYNGQFQTTTIGGNSTAGEYLRLAHNNGGGAWRLKDVGTGGVLRFDYSNADNAVAFAITGPGTTSTFGRSAPVPYAFAVDRFFLGGSTGIFYKNHTTEVNAPTTGNWSQGDIAYALQPAASGFLGWVCVTSGTPGVWKTFGAISA